jgi:aminodeoxyfutalosine synthase
MSLPWIKTDWQSWRERLEAGGRLAESEGVALFESQDLGGLGLWASEVNQRKNQGRATYVLNGYINYSNYCILSCQFCAFARKKRSADGFELSVDQILAKAQAALAAGATELHIVGGLHPSLPFSYYLDMLKALSDLKPRPQLKCFTAIEVLHLAWLSRQSVAQTLESLRAAGLDCLTGGGAEIFEPTVRKRIALGKESAEEYLEVHRTWHRLGGRSTCTMLYGHVESAADRIDHLRRLRELQDETRGFVGFIPLPYQPDNNQLAVRSAPTAADTLRTIAVSRLFLDNFRHITAYWIGLGLRLAQVALRYGASDLHGTIGEELIFHMAGANTPQSQTQTAMMKAIHEAGLLAVQRNTFYEPLDEFQSASSTPAPSPIGHTRGAGPEV